MAILTHYSGGDRWNVHVYAIVLSTGGDGGQLCWVSRKHGNVRVVVDVLSIVGHYESGQGGWLAHWGRAALAGSHSRRLVDGLLCCFHILWPGHVSVVHCLGHVSLRGVILGYGCMAGSCCCCRAGVSSCGVLALLVRTHGWGGDWWELRPFVFSFQIISISWKYIMYWKSCRLWW